MSANKFTDEFKRDAVAQVEDRGCPPAVEYSRSDQIRLADATGTQSDTAMIVHVLKGYALLRDQARICNTG